MRIQIVQTADEESWSRLEVILGPGRGCVESPVFEVSQTRSSGSLFEWSLLFMEQLERSEWFLVSHARD
ncbi:hypothetical protein KOR42_46190 [Thalassoglobus neptunius]|uniref:Uncharacterized protein n=1 Tax=Thalassoglobus neptunius TaxID=1938619 RepID=A0A5C5VXU8_9PLAN|nr:hypothetical protein KOR42_46190 [Thalassoglobus neptunius]